MDQEREKPMKWMDRIDGAVNRAEEAVSKWRKERKARLEEFSPARRIARRYREILQFAGLVFILDILTQLLFTPQSETALTMLSNGLMISGMSITAWGLIRLGEYFGSLDAVIFAAKWDFSIFGRNADTYEEQQKRSQSFEEFRRQRQQNRVSPIPLFVVGIPLLVLSGIFGYLAIH